MNMPFAGLLAHGIKTLESRNGSMFRDTEGVEVLLHVGKRTYPGEHCHLKILREAGLEPSTIATVISLPDGFTRGQVVAVLVLGKTVLMEQGREAAAIEQAVVARGGVMGRYLTHIQSARWLKKPFKVAGAPGIFKCDIPTALLPDRIL
ncbi:hypothetical protein B484DRAFT_339857 [Ochromonadaceae sp. CCMP2298]|nr:hypothetical protein B484DRAFT_339857 [Ochromonadaceae sp. CCMP2298]